MLALVFSVVLVAVVFFTVLLIRIGKRYNIADWGKPSLNILDGINRWYCKKYHRLHGDELILPEQGGVIVAGNHVSGSDPLFMIAACNRPLRFIVAKEEYERWFFHWLFKRINLIPVDRTQKSDAAFYAARRALEEGEVVALFPQGGIDVSVTPSKKLKRGVIILAQLSEAPIVITRLEGIKARGSIIGSLVVRSRTRLFVSSTITIGKENGKDALSAIESFIYPGTCRNSDI